MHRFVRVTKEKMYKVRRYWLTIAFILGFVVDNLTLNRVDQLFDNVILFSYVILAMLSMLVLYASVAGKLPERILPKAQAYAPLVVQYAFGGLLSGMLIFYGRSGTLYNSWPFLLLILVVIFGNELIKDRAQRLVFNLAIFFVGLFSYLVLITSVLTGKMGAWWFVLSGFIALMIFYGFVRLLRIIVPNFIQLQIRNIVFTTGIIFASLNFLYFTNIIPPIPLSLKDVGVYHSVVKYDDGTYRLTYEKPDWWQFFKDSDDTFHYEPGDNIFCFASVFAPTRLSTEIFHKWEYYDEAKGDWVEHGKFSYAIEGGSDRGYRGYTLVRNYREGKWRCTVETGRGQVVGRENFVIESGSRSELVTREE